MNGFPRGILGVRTADGAVVPLLDFQRAAAGRAVFTTTADGQSTAVFDFYYREPEASAWTYLDSLRLKRIPPACAGEPDLQLEAGLDSRGDLLLQTRDPVTGRSFAFALEAATLQGLLRSLPGSAATTPGSTSAPRSSRRGKRLQLLFLALALGAGLVAVGFALLRPSAAAAAKHPAAAPAAERKQPSAAAAVELPGQTAPPPEATTPMQAAAAPAPAELPEAAPSRPAPQPAAPPPPAPPEAQHSIAWGDTLWRIAESYYGERGLYRELAESNALADPDRIIAGQTLSLPPALAERTRKTQGE